MSEIIVLVNSMCTSQMDPNNHLHNHRTRRRNTSVQFTPESRGPSISRVKANSSHNPKIAARSTNETWAMDLARAILASRCRLSKGKMTSKSKDKKRVRWTHGGQRSRSLAVGTKNKCPCNLVNHTNKQDTHFQSSTLIHKSVPDEVISSFERLHLNCSNETQSIQIVKPSGRFSLKLDVKDYGTNCCQGQRPTYGDLVSEFPLLDLVKDGIKGWKDDIRMIWSQLQQQRLDDPSDPIVLDLRRAHKLANHGILQIKSLRRKLASLEKAGVISPEAESELQRRRRRLIGTLQVLREYYSKVKSFAY